MAGLLLGHMADLVSAATMADHRELAVIDSHSAVLAGMIDPDHPLDLGFGDWIAGQVRRPFRGHATPRGIPRAVRLRRQASRACRSAPMQHPAITSEASKFQPAIDTPNSVQAGRSHSTGAVPRICCFICSRVIAPPGGAVQAVGPANQCCSTPDMIEGQDDTDSEDDRQQQRHPIQSGVFSDQQDDQRDRDRRRPRPALHTGTARTARVRPNIPTSAPSRARLRWRSVRNRRKPGT